MAKHTPGTWKVESDGTTVAMADQCCIVSPAPDNAPLSEVRANASLISSAPELLESLTEMVNVFEGFARVVFKDKYVQSDAEKRAREIIRRAEGAKL